MLFEKAEVGEDGVLLNSYLIFIFNGLRSTQPIIITF